MSAPPQEEGNQFDLPKTGDEAARNRKEFASDRRKWVEALQAEGFTREEAMAIMVAPTVHINQQGAASPEMAEFLSKFSALANRQLTENE